MGVPKEGGKGYLSHKKTYPNSLMFRCNAFFSFFPFLFFGGGEGGQRNDPLS